MKKEMTGILAGVDETMINGEVIYVDGRQAIRLMRLYNIKFFAYPDEVDDLMDKEYIGTQVGSKINIIVCGEQR